MAATGAKARAEIERDIQNGTITDFRDGGDGWVYGIRGDGSVFKTEVPIAQPKGVSAIDRARAGKSPSGSAPQIGSVVDGYRFKGGDPGQQSSWEAVATRPPLSSFQGR